MFFVIQSSSRRGIVGRRDAAERALDKDASLTALRQQITACRGALDSLIADVVEGHIRDHLIGP